MGSIKTPSNSFKIMMLIREVHSLMYANIGHNMKDSGLTPQQIMVMKVIAHNKEVTPTQLCDQLSLAKATVSGMIQRLEDAGYIKRVKKEDKRLTYIIFSEKGQHFANNFKKKMDREFSNLFKNLTETEQAQIAQALTLLAKKMEK
ncbi:MAG: MarR family transcriptional regulator [Anaerovorax sp.]